MSRTDHARPQRKRGTFLIARPSVAGRQWIEVRVLAEAQGWAMVQHSLETPFVMKKTDLVSSTCAAR